MGEGEPTQDQLEKLIDIVKAIGLVMLRHEQEKHGIFPIDRFERDWVEEQLTP